MTLFLILGGSCLAIGVGTLFAAQRRMTQVKNQVASLQYECKLAKKEIEAERREAFLKLKDELYKKRKDFDYTLKSERLELERFKNKIDSRFEVLSRQESDLKRLSRDISKKQESLHVLDMKLQQSELDAALLQEELVEKLERVANLTQDQAKEQLLCTLQEEVACTHERWLQKVEEETRAHAKERSIDILIDAMQRYAADQVTLHSSSVVHLPNDEMKGRIIGKEGRNIKALEMATGMEFVIGDTPEVITISGFNPIRREIARRSLETLIADGRINPTRIEETVAKYEKEIDEIIQEYGKNAILQFNLQGVNPEIVHLLGSLHFRTSFSQNVLNHSIEVALFARMIAHELGLPHPEIAVRAGLFHDIGKALSSDCEGPHAKIGADVARRCGENKLVVNAIAAHHEEVTFASIYSAVVVIADTLSASRPGARRETLSAYIKRLEQLEDIASSFEGIKKVYAVQAGREIRVIVQEDNVSDPDAFNLARNIARKVENDMSFPGQIKVNVIREKRAIEYAR